MRKVIILFCLSVLILTQIFAMQVTAAGAAAPEKESMEEAAKEEKETSTKEASKAEKETSTEEALKAEKETTTAEEAKAEKESTAAEAETTVEETDAEEEEPAPEKLEVILDTSGEKEERIYNRYAGLFEGGDISLIIDGEDLEYIPLLTQFQFHSLDLTIRYEDEVSLSHMKFVEWLLFPEETEHVYITCGDEMKLKSCEALGQFIICLWVCCPDATLNDVPVADWAWQVYAADAYDLVYVYENDAKLHYVYELAERGALEEIDGDPVFCGKLIFDIFDDSELTSQESVIFGEAFFDVPSSWLAKNFDEADTAIYIYPVSSVIGQYSNGGEAISTYTRVMVIDLHSMKKYKDYTAVRNDPPENLTISVVDGEYSTEGAAGEYNPETAISDIVNSDSYQKKVPEKLAVETDLSEILPWVKPEEEETTAAAEPESTQEETASGDEATSEQASEPSSEQASEPTTEPVSEQTTESETTSETEPEADAKAGQQETTAQEPETTGEVYIDKGVYSWLTEDLLEEIFEELGDDLYRTTYETLKTSKDLQKGSKGDLVLALQKTLNAFGRNIAEDSSFGNATLSALNTVQTAFNLSADAKLNSKNYALLMPALLLYTNEEAASRLIEGRMSYENGNEFLYMQACACRLDEHNYRARVLFEDSGYGNSESRALDCVQDMPETGVLVGNTGAAGSNATLTIQVNNPDDSAVTCAKVFAADDTLAACLIVRGTDSAKAVLPAGEYRIISGTGYRWYGINDMFGDEGIYESLIFDSGNSTMELRSGYDYTITYNVQEHNDAAVHVGSESLNWEELGE